MFCLLSVVFRPFYGVTPFLPQMLFGDSADEATLHQVVGPRRVSGQGPRVAPQAGNFTFEQMCEIGHQGPPSICSGPGRCSGRWMSPV